MIRKTACIPNLPICLSRFPRQSRGARIRLASIHLLIGALILPGAGLSQKSGEKSRFGVAWRVIGSWHIAGNKSTVSDGDVIVPGSLLEPARDAGNHSITLLLPDGQRILYECFASRDCERGFRVPSLYREPTSIALDLLARVYAISEHAKSVHSARKQQEVSAVSSDEAVAVMGASNKADVAGLAAALSDGTYSYVARSLSRPPAKLTRGIFEKHGQSVEFSVPAEGLFDVRIFDSLNTPRIDLLLAAVRQPRGERILQSFQDVQATLKDWNEDYQGWPVHEFLRKYLESVMLGIEPPAARSAELSPKAEQTKSADVTCEPQFEPRPGVFKTDTEVKLHCATAGARIHYTVDGAQPLEGAPIYGAPIIVKSTALTIKAFASAAGKKDSPVVTGIFRIGD